MCHLLIRLAQTSKPVDGNTVWGKNIDWWTRLDHDMWSPRPMAQALGFMYMFFEGLY